MKGSQHWAQHLWIQRWCALATGNSCKRNYESSIIYECSHQTPAGLARCRITHGTGFGRRVPT